MAERDSGLEPPEWFVNLIRTEKDRDAEEALNNLLTFLNNFGVKSTDEQIESWRTSLQMAALSGGIWKVLARIVIDLGLIDESDIRRWREN